MVVVSTVPYTNTPTTASVHVDSAVSTEPPEFHRLYSVQHYCNVYIHLSINFAQFIFGNDLLEFANTNEETKIHNYTKANYIV